jgi:hypothetical protein
VIGFMFGRIVTLAHFEFKPHASKRKRRRASLRP